jgi:hypothetical protein
MLSLMYQYFPNFGMIAFETLFSIIMLLFLVRIANNILLTEEFISQKKRNLSIYLALIIAFGLTLALRSLVALLGYFI